MVFSRHFFFDRTLAISAKTDRSTLAVVANVLLSFLINVILSPLELWIRGHAGFQKY